MNYNIYGYYLIQISWETKVLILISKTYFATNGEAPQIMPLEYWPNVPYIQFSLKGMYDNL